MAMTQIEHYKELQSRLDEIERKTREEKARQASSVIEAFKHKLIQSILDEDRAMFSTGEIIERIEKA